MKTDKMKTDKIERTDYDEEWWTTEAMIRSGGSFVKALGHLYRLGDTTNKQKLRSAFPAYFREYTALIDSVKRADGLKHIPIG